MAGGVFLLNGAGAPDYGGALTVPVVVTCLMAASGGLIFGYDIGISGASWSPSPSVHLRWWNCGWKACLRRSSHVSPFWLEFGWTEGVSFIDQFVVRLSMLFLIWVVVLDFQ